MDPVASLRAAEIDVEIGGWVYTVPALTAAEWIEVLDAGPMWNVVPGLLPAEDRLSVMRDYLSGAVNADGLLEAARRVLEVAGGRKWWEIQRLVDSATAESVWPTIHGQLVLKGVDLDRITLAGFVNVIWVLALQSCQKESERQALEWQITRPPAGAIEEAEETDESEFNQILAEQARLPAG